ncbi:putative transcriptional regulator [Sphingobium sp. OAS761]|uniref:helix-turn-helix domain-containing protein n=1 Tax=Sphingobium sp. OAS761 TaxID=2817901 RepID=UPI0020A1153A|nr:helix-turn-helix transcriptional regulator [Sphingobium sp. OAS761]MCP1470991.1 putative transcriptional regulator [Sphingobium sp. OAS761]
MDADDIAAADRARAESDFTIPAEILDAILAGKAPIMAWREYRLITKKALGLKAGVSQSALSRMAKGQSQPRPATIERLSFALAVPEWALTIDQ